MKKTVLLRVLVLAAAALLLLSSCGGTAVMKYKGAQISENEFRFYLATYKARFAQTYADFKDNEAFYRQTMGDGTAEDFLFASVLQNVGYSLVCDALFDEYGLSLSDDVLEDVDGYVDSFLYDLADGNKTVLNRSLGAYGVNIKLFREILLRDERSAAVYVYLYGSDGKVGINDEDRQTYLENNYVRVRHIYVNNAYVYATDDDGNPVYGSDGMQEKTPLTGDALNAKNALVAAIDDALSSGEDFDTIYETVSEDQYYKEGYYLTRDMNFIKGVVRAAFELEIGEWTKVESDVGVHYILRLPLGEKPWTDENCADFFPDYDETVSSALFTDMLDGLRADIEYNEDVLSTYSVKDSPMNTRFQ